MLEPRAFPPHDSVPQLEYVLCAAYQQDHVPVLVATAEQIADRFTALEPERRASTGSAEPRRAPTLIASVGGVGRRRVFRVDTGISMPRSAAPGLGSALHFHSRDSPPCPSALRSTRARNRHAEVADGDSMVQRASITRRGHQPVSTSNGGGRGCCVHGTAIWGVVASVAAATVD
ncbi:uncharacterized protein PAN0_002c0920 [Moesziomyces antarcticus]|uniref:uncharacterized protein n=1 Tax=Pseudozyma antarctica TaxID=84753 RepID=UPI0007194B58|nr:uncharacterized protein PAN0_002c0920 [Moesziomyces antarcticus]GAK62718.1 hypothetical protein PAN0_002c0920 [Moesziomyces antarcticus]